MWARYLEALKTHPIRTNAATALCINFVGDIAAQTIEQKQQSTTPANIKWERSCTVAGYGLITAAPAVYWFRWLDRTFPLPPMQVNAGSLWMLAKKLTVHLGLFAPTMNCGFYGWLIMKDRLVQQEQLQLPNLSDPLFQPPTATLQFQQHEASSTFWREWYAKLEKDLWETQTQSVKVWGTAQSFNFLVLPPHTRVLFSNCVLVAWMAYLSMVGHR